MILITEARRKLDLLEQTKTDPTIILTDLFEAGIPDWNFLCNVSVDGVHFNDYLIEQLKSINVFSECCISHNVYTYSLGVPSLHKDVWLDRDLMVKFNVSKKTYKVFDDCIKEFEKEMTTEPVVPQPVEVSEFYNQFENFDVNSRLQRVTFAIKYNKTLWTKIYDMFIALTMSKKKRVVIENKIQDAYKDVDARNKRNMERYEKEVEHHEYLKRQAPAHIEDIKQKQKEIEAFLLKLGYTCDPEMDKY